MILLLIVVPGALACGGNLALGHERRAATFAGLLAATLCGLGAFVFVLVWLVIEAQLYS